MVVDRFTERLTIELGRFFQIELLQLEHGAKLRRSAALPRDRERFLEESRGRAPISFAGKISPRSKIAARCVGSRSSACVSALGFAIGIARFSGNGGFGEQARNRISTHFLA